MIAYHVPERMILLSPPTIDENTEEITALSLPPEIREYCDPELIVLDKPPDIAEYPEPVVISLFCPPATVPDNTVFLI